MQQYDIYLNFEKVGFADVVQEGLYYRITCRCKFNNTAVYRVIIKTCRDIINLGICIPQNNEYTLTKRIPVKRICSGKLSFFLQDVHPETAKEEYALSIDSQSVPISKIRYMRYKVSNDNSIVYVV